MKIVLAEERNGTQLSEQSFENDSIRIGRDPSDCRIVFDSRQFSMVSRRHAELRWHNDQWFLRDLNSTFGTFIDGQKIADPQPVKVGSRLQIGLDGPVLRVLWFDISDDLTPEMPKAQTESAVARSTAVSERSALFDERKIIHSQSPSALSARLEFISGHSTSIPYIINKDRVSLGRDTGGDVVFETAAVMVSRKHAEIKRSNGGLVISDNQSFNGTLINEDRISAPTPLYHDDKIQLGFGGPVLRLNAPALTAPKGLDHAGQRSIAADQIAELPKSNFESGAAAATMTFNLNLIASKTARDQSAQPSLLMSLTFGDKQELIIGRSGASDIELDGLQISNRHARLVRTSAGIGIEDLNSTNGVYINGNRVTRQIISPEDSVQIGSFVIKIDAAGSVGVFDTRSKTRIDAVNITKDVVNRGGGGGQIRLLDDISLSIRPNEFVGLLGPSGAGKSTLMEAMNGMRPATAGSILINAADLYQHLDSFKQSIGYVPQDDIIHRELSVYRTLYYVAELRLSRDVTEQEINQIIEEVLDVTDLSERREVQISRLSGGQRKRVSIAVELITKPSIIFLDEPTSGLDPATEEKVMNLFRQIAASGRTVILTTHAMENVRLFDKIVVLMRGKMVFYGKPDEALTYFGADCFKDLYDKLEEPVEQNLKQSGESKRSRLTEQVAEQWKRKYLQTAQYRENVFQPLKEISEKRSTASGKKRRLGAFETIRQTWTLARRYSEVLYRDKLNLFILFIQAPVIALLTFFVMGADDPRDFVYFVLSLVALWFGISVAAREIIRERAIYKRERMINLGLFPYVMSKLIVLGAIVGVQCLLLFIPLKLFDAFGLMPMPGEMLGIPQLWVMLLTAGVGVALGLLISAIVKTSEMATSIVPLILISQILFSGLVGVPGGINKAVGLFVPAAWSFDAMKRFSTLDTLQNDGAKINGKTNGQGLYEYIETENDRIIADAKRNLDDYRRETQRKIEDYQEDLRRGNNPMPPQFGELPKLNAARKIPKDLSGHINFLHPWMNEVLNQIVLMLMFFVLVIAALIVLRMQDRS